MRPRRGAPLAALLWLAGAPLVAHDVWLEPSAWDLEPGRPLAVRILVGERFVGEAVAADPRRITRFTLAGDEGEQPLTTGPGSGSAGFVRPAGEGRLLLLYETRPWPIRLAAPLFESYLAEKGLEPIAEQRAARGETARATREIYSRCAKAIVTVGSDAVSAAHRPVGCHFEIVPDARPPVAGEALTVTVLFAGEPVAGVLLTAIPEGDPSAARPARSNAAGRVTLTIDRPGRWLLEAVHMVASDPALTGADWESWWASLTFAAIRR